MPNHLSTQILPLLPLTSGVVLPGMIVTLMLETSEAKAAVQAARETPETQLVLVPRLDNRYARVGTVAKVEDVGRLQNGLDAVVVRGLARVTSVPA